MTDIENTLPEDVEEIDETIEDTTIDGSEAEIEDIKPTTKIDGIYDLFLSMIDDELLALLPPSTFRRELHKFLLMSIVRFSSCKKDLSINDFKNIERELDLGDDELLIEEGFPDNVEIIGLDSNMEYKIGIDYEITETDSVKKLELTVPVTEKTSVIFYDNGYFNEELTYKEMYLLACGMVLSWLQPKLNREENLRQMVTDKDYNRMSGANMLAKVKDLYNMTLNNYERDIIAYSFDDFRGFN